MEAYKQILLWSLILKNSRPRFFFNFYYRVIHQYRLCNWKLMQIIWRGQLLVCNVIIFLKYIQVYFRLKLAWQVEHTWGNCWPKFGYSPLRNERVIWQRSECTKREFEENFRGSRKLLHAHEKVCDENETKKQRKKRRMRKNVFGGRKPFIRRT